MVTSESWPHEPRVVALGGGHGLAASLAALRRVTEHPVAIVTVADNGGSSGRLREEFGVLPPGDLRMALAALCGDDRWGRTWATVLQHRFASSGDLDGHAVGNLLIVALWEMLGDQVAGLDWVGSLLGARGRVLPMALTPLDITATVRGADPERPDELSEVRGQVEVATTPGTVLDVRLDPPDAPASGDAVVAIDQAEWVILGPGSWYSSVIPHLLVPELHAALARTKARIVLTLNLEAQPGETDGFTPEDHLAAFQRHAPDLMVDTVIADHRCVPHPDRLRARTAALGARLVLADVAREGVAGVHDADKLGRTYALLIGAN